MGMHISRTESGGVFEGATAIVVGSGGFDLALTCTFPYIIVSFSFPYSSFTDGSGDDEKAPAVSIVDVDTTGFVASGSGSDVCLVSENGGGGKSRNGCTGIIDSGSCPPSLSRKAAPNENGSGGEGCIT
ncbi:hypothetical protein PM082_012519 [Marasmius tenuissimus]|nr:hypothetical protein PM082_012519 [Marasmius tenuissimus]